MAHPASDFLEFLQVAFHTILFARQIYPREVFEKRRQYGLPVWMSRHPDLNKYINDFIHSLRPLLEQDKVESVSLVTLDSNMQPVERVVFETRFKHNRTNDQSNQPALQNAFKDCLSKINLQASMRAPLQQHAPDSGEVHSFIATIKSREAESIQNEYWVEASAEAGHASDNTQILPVSSFDTPGLNLNLFVELL